MQSKNQTPECIVPPRHHVVLIVVYTLAIMANIYFFTLAYLLIKQLPVNETLGFFNQAGAGVIGALVGLLVRTSSDPVPSAKNPLPTEIVNKPDNPVPVDETSQHTPPAT